MKRIRNEHGRTIVELRERIGAVFPRTLGPSL